MKDLEDGDILYHSGVKVFGYVVQINEDNTTCILKWLDSPHPASVIIDRISTLISKISVKNKNITKLL